MGDPAKKISALGLSSGGLDSILSALVLKDQGIEVTWVSFETPFFSAEKAREASAMTGIPLIVRNITSVYLEILLDPPAGYGKNMNPCMDCHALMFRLAGEVMEEIGADFLFSGEVLGQRPKSQTQNALNYVNKRSGNPGYILRPLSAKRLTPTLVEEQGLVDRDQLLDFSGRSRKPQMELANKYGITKYPAPAGGCLLTDKGFSDRLRDVFANQETYGERDFELLKHGRHFRLSPGAKAIVGRNRSDNDNIAALIEEGEDIVVKMSSIPGPSVVLPHGGDGEAVRQAARLCAAYSKARAGESAAVAVIRGDSREILRVDVPDKEDFYDAIL
ncbi:MAG: tRNA 4-thiouridine(8) synthase ThiI [Desulfatibacillum sp.]|nr:tRNA 4-thiouridine(8) synthase ThiI [Desulfatibacillum sp.]